MRSLCLIGSIISYVMRAGDAFSSRYEKAMDELREKFKRAKQGLMDSVDLEIWGRMIDTSERVKDICDQVKDTREHVVATGERVIDIRERIMDAGEREKDSCELSAFIIPLSIPDCAH